MGSCSVATSIQANVPRWTGIVVVPRRAVVSTVVVGDAVAVHDAAASARPNIAEKNGNRDSPCGGFISA